jgi:hypothetical protein
MLMLTARPLTGRARPASVACAELDSRQPASRHFADH